jgi:hypothetical protein
MAPTPATRSDGRSETAGSTLSALDESVLDFERRHTGTGRAKDAAIRAAFDLSPTAYYLRLSRLIDSPEAAAYDPLLVQRLLRRVAAHGQWRGRTD